MAAAPPPGFGFVPFEASDNVANDSTGDLLKVIPLNLYRIVAQPALASHDGVAVFVDSFLAHRERRGTAALEALDLAVFAAVQAAPLLLSSSRRLVDFAALYHPPGVTPGRDDDACTRVFLAALTPALERDLQRSFETFASTPGPLGMRRAAGMRGVLEMCPRALVRPLASSLRGLRGSPLDALATLARWFMGASGPNEAAHVRFLARVALEQLFFNDDEAPVLLSLLLAGDDDDVKRLLADTRIRTQIKDLHRRVASVDEAQCEFAAGVLEHTPESACAEEEVAAASGATATSTSALREIAPHLSDDDCAALLAAFDGDVERAVASALDSPSAAPPALPATAPVPATAPGPAALQVRIDKVRPPAALDEYDDEYDDALDGRAFKPAAASDAEDEGDSAEHDDGGGGKGPRVVDADEFARAAVDVDGQRRDARGRVVVEDALARPNRNRDVAPPPSTQRRPPPPLEQRKPAVADEERVRRERERKTKQGSRQRTRGADRKQGAVP